MSAGTSELVDATYIAHRVLGAREDLIAAVGEPEARHMVRLARIILVGERQKAPAQTTLEVAIACCNQAFAEGRHTAVLAYLAAVGELVGSEGASCAP